MFAFKLYTNMCIKLVSCSKNPKECGGTGGCSGSTQWNAFDYTIGAGGIATEESYPYTSGTGMDGDCLSEQIVPAATITGYERLPANNYSALMNAVATLGPIAIRWVKVEVAGQG